MGDMWRNRFYFVLVTYRQPIFKTCKEILSALSCSLAGADVNKP